MSESSVGRRIDSAFSAPWWLRGPHLQTLWGALTRGTFHNNLQEERIPTPDKDFLRVFWSSTPADPSAPLVLLMHGLAGSVDSPYMQGLFQALGARRVPAVALQLRGSGLFPNNRARSYHSGDTADLEYFLGVLAERYPQRRVRAVGVSLSGNLLLRHLGERGDDSPLERVIAICPPVNIHRAVQRLSQGFSRGYQVYLVALLKAAVARKRDLVQRAGYDIDAILSARTFEEFDDHFTAPVHGFRDANHYYTAASSAPILNQIRVPTRILFAHDDPFMHADIIPSPAMVSPAVTVEVSKNGGHVGFVEGWGRYWLDRHIPDLLLMSDQDFRGE